MSRVQRSRSAGARIPKGAICVSRPSPFCNPFLTAIAFRHWLETGDIAWSVTTAWAHFLKPRDYEMRREFILTHLPELRGKTLACWCPLTKECHADVLIEMASVT